ncbi:MAG: glycosyltransferase, partial [Pseudomonadales bacterium]|nr:glycosyltransferase [Pseudomonadales bacterium]
MGNDKKVLHLTYDMRIGGTEQVIKNIVQGKQCGDFEHSILCIEQPIGPFGKMLIEEGITINAIQRKDGFDIALIKQIR